MKLNTLHLNVINEHFRLSYTLSVNFKIRYIISQKR